MRVLLDECVPRRLRSELPGHAVLTVGQAGWAGASDATLLRRAMESFDVLLTVDRSLAQVRDALGLPIPIVVLVAARNDFETLKPLIPEVLRRLPLLRPGQVVRVGQ